MGTISSAGKQRKCHEIDLSRTGTLLRRPMIYIYILDLIGTSEFMRATFKTGGLKYII